MEQLQKYLVEKLTKTKSDMDSFLSNVETFESRINRFGQVTQWKDEDTIQWELLLLQKSFYEKQLSNI